jgi:biopolymer transport protein ExbD
MADLGEKPVNNPHEKTSNYRKKKSIRVDLTPMVDLGFLLITFFITTTTWSQPRAMNIFLPKKGDSTLVPETATLTLIPVSARKVYYYEGLLVDALKSNKMGLIDLSQRTGIGNEIRMKQYELDKNPAYLGVRKDLIVLIKPTSLTDYQTVISSLDEMTINGIKRYVLIDLGQDEKKLLGELSIRDR